MTHLAYRRGRKPRARTQPDHIARINTLTTTARNTWFAMLGVLAFVGVTLLGVQHIDFYGIDRATQLPLIGVSVPTRLFFYVAPVLTAAVYCYFHIYQIRLWDALSTAPAQIRGEPLSEHIHPWLLSSAALELRNFIRSGPRSAIGRWFWALPGISRIIQHPATPEPHCTTNRALSDIAAILSFGLAWIFGLVVLLYGWKQSLPAREFWMTATNAAAFYISGWVGADSLVVLWRRMRGISQEDKPWVWFNWFGVPASLCLFLGLALVTYERTTNANWFSKDAFPFMPETILGAPVFGLAQLNLENQSLVERPRDWLSDTTAKRDFRAIWCKREETSPCPDDLGDRQSEFDAEWSERRNAQIATLKKPLGRVLNLQGAKLQRAFLTGLDMEDAELQRADLRRAQMQGVVLNRANMQIADFTNAQAQGASFGGADFTGAYLTSAQMHRAYLGGALLESTDLTAANLQNASFESARFSDISETRGADFSGTDFQNARLRSTTFLSSKLQNASFKFARLEAVQFDKSDLSGASFFGARLTKSSLAFNTLDNVNMAGMTATETGFARASMKGANLQSAWLNSPYIGGADLTGADMRFTKLQGGAVADIILANADLSFSFLSGSEDRDLKFDDSNWSGSQNQAGALRRADLTEVIFDEKANWLWAFGDGSVSLPENAVDLFGNRCHWIDGVAPSDAQFFGRWRGWFDVLPVKYPFGGFGDIKPAWSSIAPPGFADVTPIPPPEGCTPEVLPQ